MSDRISIHPYWRAHIQERLLPELENLDATVEINEDGLMRATWPAGVEAIQSTVIVKLHVLPILQWGTGWAAPGDIALSGRRFVMTRQLRVGE